MKINNGDIVDGAADLIDSEVKPEEVKIRITTWVDSDVLQQLKQEAEKQKTGYQTLLNQKLREGVLGEKEPLSARVERLEMQFAKLQNG